MRAGWALAAVLPFAPFVVAVVAHAPLEDPRVVSLAGTWGVVLADSRVVDASQLRVEGTTQTVVLPGRLPTGRATYLVRTFELDGAPRDEHGLVFGGVSNGVAEVWLNGVWIGSEGVPSIGHKLSHVALNLYAIDRLHLRAGQNTIVVVITPERGASLPRSAVVERRLLVGPLDVLRPWFDRVFLLGQLLELGGLAMLAFVAALVAVLSATEREAGARRVQRAVVGLSLAVVAYLAAKSGLLILFGFERQLITLFVTAIAWTMPALLEQAVLGRITLVQRVNRVICAAHIIAQLFIYHELMYLGFIPYLFLLIAYSAFITVRGAFRAPSMPTVLLASSVTAMVAAAVNDLCTDLSLLATPRLFTLAAVDMGLVGAIFVVGRFVRAMQDNTALLVNVEEKNAALVHALDRAEESTRMKSAFLANTSHELRTPLNSIINVPEGLLEEFVQRPFVVCSACASLFEAPEGYQPDERCPECGAAGTLSTELRAVFAGDADAAMRYLKSIQQAGRHLLAVVTDILDFSKIDAGRMEVHLEDVVVADMLEKLGLAMFPLADGRAIHLLIESCEGSVRGDPVKLTQVLMNLVSNAIKFSPEGSEVKVAAAVDDDAVTLSVGDRGIGISAADSGRIFESFVQVDNSHTRKVGGTGLGLAISKNLVELMHGTLRVESVVGQGSTFIVTLPRSPP